MEKQTWKSITAGIVAIVAGAFGLMGIARNPVPTMGHRIPDFMPHMYNFMGNISLPITILAGVLGILAIVGGVYALRRKIWGLALAGSIAAIFGSFPLGIAAVVLTALSKKEFE